MNNPTLKYLIFVQKIKIATIFFFPRLKYCERNLSQLRNRVKQNVNAHMNTSYYVSRYVSLLCKLHIKAYYYLEVTKLRRILYQVHSIAGMGCVAMKTTMPYNFGHKRLKDIYVYVEFDIKFMKILTNNSQTKLFSCTIYYLQFNILIAIIWLSCCILCYTHRYNVKCIISFWHLKSIGSRTLCFIKTSIWWTSFKVFSQRCNFYSPVFGKNRVFEYVSEIIMILLRQGWKRFRMHKVEYGLYIIHENSMLIVFIYIYILNIWNLRQTKFLNHLYRNILKKETPGLIGCKFIFVSFLY